ncbi:hypothetical protein ACJ72_05790 [Emergomyces africanus]|uniref:Uncharacterized protein n=1 Tax=Emergomyces africanus TaxID=1955775 RepID=A0A1B7NTB9_9EURO|nr:hypothetical protein ACJ72_05790 [Emergomyces africanus]
MKGLAKSRFSQPENFNRVDYRSPGMYDTISTGTLQDKTKAVRNQLTIDFDLASVPFYAEDKDCADRLPPPINIEPLGELPSRNVDIGRTVFDEQLAAISLWLPLQAHLKQSSTSCQEVNGLATSNTGSSSTARGSGMNEWPAAREQTGLSSTSKAFFCRLLVVDIRFTRGDSL